MKPETLPLLDIFNTLRQRHGLLLGVDDYLVVLRSLQAGFGLSSSEDLKQLCCLVWAKSDRESRLIRRLIEQVWNQVLKLPSSSNHINTPETPIETPASSSVEQKIAGRETPKIKQHETLNKTELPPVSPNLTPEPVQAVQAVRSSQQNRELRRPRYILLTEYFPVTRRQMKQSWRYLRRPVREGIPTELDAEATVAKISREGILLEPILIPPRINRADLVLMIDQEGSMVPFHQLSRQLVETAQRGGRFRQTRVFYFHDYVDEYLYRDPAFLNAQSLSEFLEDIEAQTPVLIVSDGGAARGTFDIDRIESTQKWIEQLQQSVRSCAWLNPMPRENWHNTSAIEIARFLPMFEMSRQGMNDAITVLRGRYVVDIFVN
jgi:uncharacterized protein with von Willebrand factor type A (vWA) domain